MPKKPAAMVGAEDPGDAFTPGIPTIAMLPTAASWRALHHLRACGCPSGRCPSDWTRVAMPATSRSALIRKKAISSREEAGRLADDRGHGDSATVHQQHMLEARQQQLRQRRRRWSTLRRVGDAAISYHGHCNAWQAFYCCQSQADTGKSSSGGPGISGRTSHRLQGDAVGLFYIPVVSIQSIFVSNFL